MLYPVWKTSYWVTFWSSESGNLFKKDQIFEIFHFNSIQFTYEDLKNNLEDCIELVKYHFWLESELMIYSDFFVNFQGKLCYTTNKFLSKSIKISNNQIEELIFCINEFIQEVKNDDFLL